MRRTLSMVTRVMRRVVTRTASPETGRKGPCPVLTTATERPYSPAKRTAAWTSVAVVLNTAGHRNVSPDP